MAIVTTVTAYIEGGKELIDQPGFYDRLHKLLVDFEVSGSVLFAIEEQEV